MRGGSTYLKRERLGLGLESLLYPSRLGLGWGLYLWMRVVPWPCGKTKLTRAHARGGKLGLRVRMNLVGSSMEEDACACGFPVPRNGLLGPMRIIRSRAGVSG